jgi:hypothetical protein
MTVHPIQLTKLLLPLLAAGIGFVLLRRPARVAPPTPRLPVRAKPAPARPRRSPRAGALGFGLIPPAAFWDAERDLDDDVDDPAEVAADSRSMISDASRYAAAIDPSGLDDPEDRRGVPW